MSEQNRGRAGTDEIGRSPEAMEHDIERDWGREGPGVQRNEDLKNAERMPRRGNEEDKPFSDALGD
jgi:hypothetical protein